MNLLKHMEAVFVMTLGLACAAAVAIDNLPTAQAQIGYAAATEQQANVVVVHGKRMTAAEKKQSLAEERLAASKAAPANT